MNARPSGELPKAFAMTSKALATLKRIFGIGSFDNSRRGPITSVLTISRLSEGDMVYNIEIS